MRFGLREIIFLLVLLAVPVSSFIFVFKPRNDQIRQAKAEIETKQNKLVQLQEVTARIPDIGLEIENGRKAIEQIEEKFPSKEEVDVVLESVWQIAEKHDLQVVKTVAEDTVPASMYQEQPLKTTIEGRFDGFYQFLLDLEAMSRITRINDMKIEKVTKGRDADVIDGAMKAEFTLSIFYATGS
jgi:Tfp pilus assembly protein PilO